MAGIDRFSGQILDGWAHVAQSLQVIYTTSIGSRVMRRTFGAEVPALLGRSIDAGRLLRFQAAMIVAAELWEPRVRIVAIETLSNPPNSPEKIRSGALSMRALCRYRPRGHLGDPTEDAQIRTLSIGAAATGSFEVTP